MTGSDFPRLPSAAKVSIRELEAQVTADTQRIAERDTKVGKLTKRLNALAERYRPALAQQ
ncbi:hypothetical protein WM04_20715 [Burkholderia ubonensis]|uniref:hypothetical protein n=1 Tax=Burkholderia ubonensis TaxID=101571 RepID=UPI0007599488|nr:hypothetical protein WM04_20715 [Burkholderia ubonensis]KWK83215.1 hypothetical protein WM15_19960 [Burkholderia ubonensis]